MRRIMPRTLSPPPLLPPENGRRSIPRNLEPTTDRARPYRDRARGWHASGMLEWLKRRQRTTTPTTSTDTDAPRLLADGKPSRYVDHDDPHRFDGQPATAAPRALTSRSARTRPGSSSARPTGVSRRSVYTSRRHAASSTAPTHAAVATSPPAPTVRLVPEPDNPPRPERRRRHRGPATGRRSPPTSRRGMHGASPGSSPAVSRFGSSPYGAPAPACPARASRSWRRTLTSSSTCSRGDRAGPAPPADPLGATD